MTMPDMKETSLETTNDKITTAHMNADLIVSSNGKMPANLETEALPGTSAGDAAAGHAAENLKGQNGSGETALDNTTYNNDSGNGDMDGEDEPSPMTGNDSGGAGYDATDNDVDLIAVAALAIPQTAMSPLHDIDISTLPTLSPLITRRDISRRDLPLICHVVGCNLGLGPQAEYYQRYRICKEHLRSAALLVDGVPQRFCQQCGKFHDLDAFDGDKRNCRARLAQHNSRRRKAGAGAVATDVIPYGQGNSGRKRIPTSFEGFNTEFDFDFGGGGGGGDSRRKRARIPVSKEFPPPAKAIPRQPRTTKNRRGRQDQEDNGFLDQLLAAATGLEEEEEQGAVQPQQQQQLHRQQNQYYNDSTQDDEPYTYDPTATLHTNVPAPMPAPIRVMSRPVAPAVHHHQPQYNSNGRAPVITAGGVRGSAAGMNGGGRGYSQFGGWPASALGGPGYNMPPSLAPPPHASHMYGAPPAVPGSGAAAVAAAVSELERVMGRQLLQSLMAGAGLPAAASAAMPVAAPLPPPQTQQQPVQQLFDVIRSLAGGGSSGAAAASYYPPPPPAVLQPQQPHVYRPTPSYAAPGAPSFGGEAPQQDRNAGAQNALDALRKLVSTLPTKNNPSNGNAAAPAPIAGGPIPAEPLVIKSEPVGGTDSIVAPPSQQHSPKSGSLIEQLAAALKSQTEANNAVIGHHAAAALVETGRDPAAVGGVGGVGTGFVEKDPSTFTSGASSAQQDVIRGLLAMLDKSKAGGAAAAAAAAVSSPAAAPAAMQTEPVSNGQTSQLLMSLLQQQAENVVAPTTEPTPPPET